MISLLIDVNLDGHALLLDRRLRTSAWLEFYASLDLRLLHFEDVGLDRSTKDEAVWQFCQDHGYFLLTANRNQDSADSLEATIRKKNTSESLPVFTFADAERIYQSPAYLDNVIERLLDYLLNPEQYRGAGRLFLP